MRKYTLFFQLNSQLIVLIVIIRIQQKWKEAADYADKLRQESRWSPCTFTYQYAVYLYMMNEDKNDELINKKIKELMR